MRHIWGRCTSHGKGAVFFGYLVMVAFVPLLVLTEAANGAGPYRPFQAGLWSGGAYTDDRTGNFSHCSAGVANDSGYNLFVVSTQTHGWWLGLWNPRWSLTPNATMQVKLRFDVRA